MKGVKNARDLGGCRMLIRTAHLADATDADLEYLSSIPVAKVIDFRKDEELQGKADRPVQGAEYVRIPVDASGNVAAQASEEEREAAEEREEEGSAAEGGRMRGSWVMRASTWMAARSLMSVWTAGNSSSRRRVLRVM